MAEDTRIRFLLESVLKRLCTFQGELQLLVAKTEKALALIDMQQAQGEEGRTGD